MKQNHEIRFRVLKEEKEKIKRQAEAVGMNVKTYILHLIKNTRVRVVVE